MKQKILVIEDDASFRRTLARMLSENGYAASQASAGKAGLLCVLNERPDLVILDLVLPGMQGMEVCRELKRDARTAAIPVLILTGNDREGQDIACLDLGADDYLTKPAKTQRLLAHCRALLRRGAPDGGAMRGAVSIGALSLDYAGKLAVLAGEEHPELTPKEFGLLFDLALKSPEPQDRGTLYRRVWGMEPPSEGSLKTVDVHARRIRLKLGWRAQEWLSFVHGRGYRLAPPV